MNHIPQLDGTAWTCPVCPWRAVLNGGRIVQQQAGDAGHDHIGQAMAQRAAMRAEAERACAHLQQQYARNRLELKQYLFLLRHIVAEFAP